MEDKTNFFEAPETVGWLDPTDPETHNLRQIYATVTWYFCCLPNCMIGIKDFLLKIRNVTGYVAAKNSNNSALTLLCD